MTRKYLPEAQRGDPLSLKMWNSHVQAINRLENRSNVAGQEQTELGGFWYTIPPENTLIRYVELLADITPDVVDPESDFVILSSGTTTLAADDVVVSSSNVPPDIENADVPAVVLVWNGTTREWGREAHNYIYVAKDALRASQGVFDAGDRLYVWLHRQSNRWLPMPQGNVRIAVTVREHSDDESSESPGTYPASADHPNTYPIAFCDASYTEESGDGNPNILPKNPPQSPHAFVLNLGRNYLYLGAKIQVFHQQGRWYTNGQDTVDFAKIDADQTNNSTLIPGDGWIRVGPYYAGHRYTWNFSTSRWAKVERIWILDPNDYRQQDPLRGFVDAETFYPCIPLDDHKLGYDVSCYTSDLGGSFAVVGDTLTMSSAGSIGPFDGYSPQQDDLILYNPLNSYGGIWRVDVKGDGATEAVLKLEMPEVEYIAFGLLVGVANGTRYEDTLWFASHDVTPGNRVDFELSNQAASTRERTVWGLVAREAKVKVDTVDPESLYLESKISARDGTVLIGGAENGAGYSRKTAFRVADYTVNLGGTYTRVGNVITMTSNGYIGDPVWFLNSNDPLGQPLVQGDSFLYNPLADDTFNLNPLNADGGIWDVTVAGDASTQAVITRNANYDTVSDIKLGSPIWVKYPHDNLYAWEVPTSGLVTLNTTPIKWKLAPAKGKQLDFRVRTIHYVLAATTESLPSYTQTLTENGEFVLNGSGAAPLIDGVTLAVGMKILLNNRGALSVAEEGVYKVLVLNPWRFIRIETAELSTESANNLPVEPYFVFVKTGRRNSQTLWSYEGESGSTGKFKRVAGAGGTYGSSSFSIDSTSLGGAAAFTTQTINVGEAAVVVLEPFSAGQIVQGITPVYVGKRHLVVNSSITYDLLFADIFQNHEVVVLERRSSLGIVYTAAGWQIDGVHGSKYPGTNYDRTGLPAALWNSDHGLSPSGGLSESYSNSTGVLVVGISDTIAYKQVQYDGGVGPVNGNYSMASFAPGGSGPVTLLPSVGGNRLTLINNNNPPGVAMSVVDSVSGATYSIPYNEAMDFVYARQWQPGPGPLVYGWVPVTPAGSGMTSAQVLALAALSGW